MVLKIFVKMFKKKKNWTIQTGGTFLKHSRETNGSIAIIEFTEYFLIIQYDIGVHHLTKIIIPESQNCWQFRFI